MADYRTALAKVLWKEQEGRCIHCDEEILWTGDLTHIDHLDPKSRGGKDELENFGLSCVACNLSKTDMTVSEFKEFNIIRRAGEQSTLLLPKFNSEEAMLKEFKLTIFKDDFDSDKYPSMLCKCNHGTYDPNGKHIAEFCDGCFTPWTPEWIKRETTRYGKAYGWEDFHYSRRFYPSRA